MASACLTQLIKSKKGDEGPYTKSLKRLLTLDNRGIPILKRRSKLEASLKKRFFLAARVGSNKLYDYNLSSIGLWE